VGAASTAGAQSVKGLKTAVAKPAPQKKAEPLKVETPKPEVANIDTARMEPLTPMTREQALKTLGLESDATDFEIKMALRDTAARLNGSNHPLPSKIDQAREILAGKASS
jgi:hypothetical protein